MVPLSEYGINDPCNLQLLCQECNLSKSNKDEVTSIKYRTWW
ncbi:MAG: HNH endonuclease [Candidatus Aminicenantes bacterium]|nr:HNH endonuclease [Candidatus Aminicenantes bacterium]